MTVPKTNLGYFTWKAADAALRQLTSLSNTATVSKAVAILGVNWAMISGPKARASDQAT